MTEPFGTEGDDLQQPIETKISLPRGLKLRNNMEKL